MGFDFVLEHRAARFFATERARVGLFNGRGVAADVMPAKFYAGANGKRTRRAFVDKQPVFLLPQSGDLVHFAYIDEGVLSTAGFETWLNHYTPLFRSLGSFVVVYVATSPAFFGLARNRFDRAYGPSLFDETAASEELAGYFRDRQLVEQKQFAVLGRVGMDRFRAAHRRLEAPAISTLYRRWLVEGDAAFSGALDVASRGEFLTYLLPHDYDLFGTVSGAIAS
jgi:hypothetical protein